MQIIDNINKTVKEDLQESIRRGSKMSVAAACFSMYAYQELKSSWSRWMNSALFSRRPLLSRNVQRRKSASFTFRA